MLEIFNNLAPFFEDSYRRVGVREYAKLIGVSPPTSSGVLSKLNKENLLLKEDYKNYILYFANKENKVFIDISRIYWHYMLRELIAYLEKHLLNPSIILYGSLSKAEVRSESDIDLAIFAHKKNIDVETFEKKLKRKIQIFWYGSLSDIKSEELANNIINGYLLSGRLKL